MWQKKDIVNEFQRLGKRITKQRMVILDVILEQNWTDCKEVYYEAAERFHRGTLHRLPHDPDVRGDRCFKASLPVCAYR